MKRLLALLTLALLVAATPAGAQESLTQDQVAAYVAVVKADHARDRGAKDEATRLYREAMDKYQAIARKYPDWHPDVVQYRLSYCQNEMASLSARTDGEKPPPAAEGEPAVAAPDPATAEALQRLSDLETENRTLREQNAGLATDLAAVQKARLDAPELAASRDEAARLLEHLTTLSNRLAGAIEEHDKTAAELVSAREKLNESKDKLKDAQKGAKNVDELRAERDRLQAELKTAQEAAQSQAQSLEQAGAAAKQVAELTQERDRLQAELKTAQEAAQAQAPSAEQVAATEQATAERAQEIEKLKGELKTCQETRDGLIQQLAAASEAISSLSAQAPPTTDADIPQIQAEVRQLGEALDKAARELDESREAALELLKPVPAK